ncbi:hypothetical protein ACIA5A_19975 [Micromonospora sp. NPDC051300]|uniref:zinc finger domain-containing protein n=1 Tax=Micromonospora sp. NPDC051300 TaxID=3364286 RepID=UPI003797F80A
MPDRIWEALYELAAAAPLLDDPRLVHRPMRKIVESMLDQGFQRPATGLFVRCPVCDSEIGQICINVPRHTLDDPVHPERLALSRTILMEAG